MTFHWSKETYEQSVSSRCWAYTRYGEGWDNCPALADDGELRHIVELENGLPEVPAWAKEMVERVLTFLPGCPHYALPQPYVEAVDALGKESPPDFVHGCYTADGARKKRMLDYVFCLDAWLADAAPEQAAAELEARGAAGVDWPAVCRRLWQVLGAHTELKDLLVKRLLHRQRWWTKSLVWEDDARDRFCQDQYLGDVCCQGDHYGNPAFADPYFAELQVPRVNRMEKRLAEVCPDWRWFLAVIRDSWLCGPKAFRFLERVLWSIGKERPSVPLPSHPMETSETVPGFLQCEDTYPDRSGARTWLTSFVQGIRCWLSGTPVEEEVAADASRRLAEQTPTKLWLARLYARKLELLNPYGAFT